MAVQPRKYRKADKTAAKRNRISERQAFDNQSVQVAESMSIRAKQSPASKARDRVANAANNVQRLVAKGFRLNEAEAGDTYLRAVSNFGSYREKQAAEGRRRMNKSQKRRQKDKW